ncbi:uncharacterized protein BP01DRAFT_83364 [Aspergillus saccharolyticus JOP 1030-1]|uniref:Uncharacterized protein n=1 Tax=Aspergillus saccharolyticus JOP 1030-1 TaxID=1450539 RepID=A0A318ZAJ0_9EURO|nr:hypothetical protein BP01DRAFT_83364 [Aspergillus saccharolyticus JOP 1030-1]PYH44455.1 hypothetical protein BP01DRAFT_83364 [Aspergillus saccharolyticus JOP 1030-1]
MMLPLRSDVGQNAWPSLWVSCFAHSLARSYLASSRMCLSLAHRMQLELEQAVGVTFLSQSKSAPTNRQMRLE